VSPRGRRRPGQKHSGGGRPQDHFGRQAQKEGHRARAVYKLEEIDRRLRLFKSGHKVLDLGAAPGSWSLYAAQRVGPGGKVLGLDRHAIDPGGPPQLQFLQRDLTEAGALDDLELQGFHVVLSDMAPRTSGMRHRDQYLSFELFCMALQLADTALVQGGSFVGKIFQGEEFPEARRRVAERFEKVRIIKPEASRSESYEVFLVGLSKRPDPERDAQPPEPPEPS